MHRAPPDLPPPTMTPHLPLIPAMAVVQWGVSSFSKNEDSNLKGEPRCSSLFVTVFVAMPHLPQSLTSVQSAVVSLLCPRHDCSNLCAATGIAEALNVTANVNENSATSASDVYRFEEDVAAWEGAEPGHRFTRPTQGRRRRP